jgi:hypothetical protein
MLAFLVQPIHALSPLINQQCIPSGDSVRSSTDIIWSCLVTIIGCTWVAIHPNIPNPTMGRVRTTLHRLRLMLVALFGPELIIIWAVRQWIAAYKIGEQYRRGTFLYWYKLKIVY